jgi:hypothetical protein
MDAPAPPSDLDATLAELTAIGVSAVRTVERLMQIERETADIVATWLPEKASRMSSHSDAEAAADAIDRVTTALAGVVTRLDVLARAQDRLSRSVRLSVALRRRLQTGWTGASASDNRAAMQKRQVKNGVGEKIRREAAERETEDLFAGLDEHLADPDLDKEIQATSVEAVVDRICRDIGLAIAAYAPFTQPGNAATPRPIPAHPPDTG